MAKKYYWLLILLGVGCRAFAQSFTPKDTVLANNVFQVEFSDDSRSMVWCEQIPLTAGKAKVWYADMDLELGLPDLANKQLIDTIQAQGWPYWGQDNISVFFLIKNQHGAIKYTRRTGINTLTTINLGTVNGDAKSLLNVSKDSTKAYFWVNYVVKNPVSTGLDSLFAFRSDNPGERIFINAEKKNSGGSAYELTFPRWMAQSEILAYPFRPFTTQPYWDMKFWNGNTKTSAQVTNDIPSSIFNHHVDDLPFRLPQFPGDTFMFSSKAANKLAIYKKAGTYFTQVQLHTSPTTIVPTTLTSFEPFTINTDQTYGAYQVYSGSVIPGTTPGEIWLIGIFNDPLHVKISDYDGEIAVDPEYVIGTKKVWIFYYGRPGATGLFNLHRCETPLVIGTSSVPETLENSKVMVSPNPFSDKFMLQHTIGDVQTILYNLNGQIIYAGNNMIAQDFSKLASGVYFLQVIPLQKGVIQTIKLVKL
ncbi:MAG: T9SS type A sorting domain-containing protein [Bacteroidota bacterium]